ncbi:hypothetical protein PHYBOEH_000157 [Phytophthora boehmeriae]|uniref:Fe2OG dioxygenase domain-containing protein n=1 Tax=Phytophthora boehmeriae TaxID=109152 RepID=A0A8T1X6J5_9STRA|nr:hypothetical protein PHYBOEH_000157 [Phytophthora boehmeriae]
MTQTAKAEARLVLHQLTQFDGAVDALTRLFDGFAASDSRRCAVLLHLLHWQNTQASSSLVEVLEDLESSGGDDQTAVRSGMTLMALGKPVLLFATSIYDEELALLIWSGFLQFQERHPQFDLTRQVLDNSTDSLGYSALHYAVEAQMGEFLGAVCKGLSQEEVAPLVGRVATQDVTLPVNTSQSMGKNIASGGCSLLHLAAKKGELEMVQMLVAPPMLMDPKTLRDWDGNSPARVAAIHGHQDDVTGEETLSLSDVEELRAQRETMARERYLAHLKPQEPMLEPSVFSDIWGIEETTLVQGEVNRLAAEQGWCQERHASYQTTDMPCHHVAGLNAWVRATLTDRLFPRIAKRYQLPKTQRLLFRDLFFVKYEAREGERSDLALHRDGSVLSFNMLLNSADEFTGGGTYFDATKRTIHITQGDVAVHSGKVLHAGAPVLTGQRQILVGFLDVAGSLF